MPLQNRVDPFGVIRAVPQRGLFTGNRGVIHDPATRTLLKRGWTTKAWLICECAFKGRRREVMGRNGRQGGAGWTELFFLDEVTALAAGHRPCFHCRRERAEDFTAACAAAFAGSRPAAPAMDRLLHRQRLASGGIAEPLAAETLARLPDGVMVMQGARALAIRSARLYEWSFDGYRSVGNVVDFEGQKLFIVTPALTIAALGRGYRPVWHPSGQG